MASLRLRSDLQIDAPQEHERMSQLDEVRPLFDDPKQWKLANTSGVSKSMRELQMSCLFA